MRLFLFRDSRSIVCNFPIYASGWRSPLTSDTSNPLCMCHPVDQGRELTSTHAHAPKGKITVAGSLDTTLSRAIFLSTLSKRRQCNNPYRHGFSRLSFSFSLLFLYIPGVAQSRPD